MTLKTRILLTMAALLLFALCGCEVLRASKVHDPNSAEKVEARENRERPSRD